MTIERIETDILILGSGGAGLFAALHAHARDPSLAVTLATKGLLGKCGCTRMVQGGYNVSLHPGDSVERHFMDTIEGGKWLPNQELAWTLVSTAPERLRELENEIGCFFDRNADGSLHGKAFAGQTFDRTVHKGDLTGIEIINRLMEQVWKRRTVSPSSKSIGRSPSFPARDGRRPFAGVLMVDVRTGCVCASFRLSAVLMATGGGPTMYRYHTPVRRQEHGRTWRWRCAPAYRCETWRWCSSIPTGLLAGPGHAHDRHRSGRRPARRGRPPARRRGLRRFMEDYRSQARTGDARRGEPLHLR